MDRRFCAVLRKIHREILVEYEKRNPKVDWEFSLKGVTARKKAENSLEKGRENG
jgi:hypothetical protein